jgi:hypothetical protein
VAYTFYASDGSSIRAVVVGEASDSADKSSNKAMSAALKYALLQIFCVPTESDDADAYTHEAAPRRQAQPQPSRPQAVPNAMSVHDKLLAEVKDLLNVVAHEEAMAQLQAFNVERVGAMTEAQLREYKTGLELAIKNGRIKKEAA